MRTGTQNGLAARYHTIKLLCQEPLESRQSGYHHAANIVATNRPIEDWGKILSDNATASAILDRLLEEAHLIKIPGRSYRLKEIVKEQKENKKLANQKKSP